MQAVSSTTHIVQGKGRLLGLYALAIRQRRLLAGGWAGLMWVSGIVGSGASKRLRKPQARGCRAEEGVGEGCVQLPPGV